LDQGSFANTVIDHKFNHHGYKSGYEIAGDYFGSITQTETHYDGPNSRRYGDAWVLGRYEKTVGNVMHYNDGTYCGPAGRSRIAEVSFTCGDKLAITKMTEPRTCLYKIEATKPCLADRPPELRVAKLGELFDEYADLWLTRWDTFSNRMKTRMNALENKMIAYYHKHKDTFGYCQEDDSEEADNTRFDRSDPCKGAIQLTKSHKKWAAIYNNHPNRDPNMSNRIATKMDNIRDKILGKLEC